MGNCFEMSQVRHNEIEPCIFFLSPSLAIVDLLGLELMELGISVTAGYLPGDWRVVSVTG